MNGNGKFLHRYWNLELKKKKIIVWDNSVFLFIWTNIVFERICLRCYFLLIGTLKEDPMSRSCHSLCRVIPLFFCGHLPREQRLYLMSSDSNHDRQLFVKLWTTQIEPDNLTFRTKPVGMRSLGAPLGRWHWVHWEAVLSGSWNGIEALPVRGALRGAKAICPL